MRSLIQAIRGLFSQQKPALSETPAETSVIATPGVTLHVPGMY